MNEDLAYRMKQWTPPKRPEWVSRINEEGACLDLRAVVPLDENSLIDWAKKNTGLSDFGSDDWREPFQVFVKALDEEANLNLMGRLMTRSDLLMHLEARLRIEDTYKRHPEIEDEQIESPTLIVGSGRCGTSAMMSLLACDPDIALARHWEALLPAPSPEASTYYSDSRIAIADGRMTQWNRVTPEVMTMHEFAGDTPTELIQIEAISFQSVAWLYLYGFVPSYIGYMAQRDAVPALSYAKRALKVLQWRNPRKRWVLKSPDALRYLPDAFEVFPDLRLVWMHRDPIKTVSSMVSLIGTLFWVRSDKRLDPNTFEQLTNPTGMASMFNRAIGWLDEGVIPPGRLMNMQYDDFVADPLASAAALYKHAGISMSEQGQRAIETYLNNNPRESRPVHKYSAGDVAKQSQERALFKRYQDYFNVRSEV